MRITLGEAVDSVEALDVLIRSFALPLRVGYDLTKTLKSCRDEAKTYDELVTELQKQYTIETPQQQKILDPERIKEYVKEVQDLREKEVEVWGKERITLTALESHLLKANRQIKPDDKDYVPMVVPAILTPLHWLIVEDEIDEAVAKGEATAIPVQ